MIPAEFDYLQVATVQEAVAALIEHGEDAKVLAGGQSLVPMLRQRRSYPGLLVDVGRVAQMRGVREDGANLVIGASTTHVEVMHDRLVRAHANLLMEVTAVVADPAVRCVGTLGGAVADADPAGDLGAALLALDARLVLAGPEGRRTVAAGDFFEGDRQTVLGPEDLLVEVRVPKHGPQWGFRYEKFRPVAEPWAIVGVAAAIRRVNGSIAEARVGLTNMACVPLRATAVEVALTGAELSLVAVDAAAQSAAEGSRPVADRHAQIDYREHLARVLTRRAVSAAAGLSEPAWDGFDQTL